MALITVYKRGQGQIVRWSTIGGIWLIFSLGMWWLASDVFGTYALWVRAVALALAAAGGAALSYWATNTPRPTEFLIMTESEMRKVVWPSRQVVIDSTKVVILLTLLMAVLLFAVDLIFRELASMMHLI